MPIMTIQSSLIGCHMEEGMSPTRVAFKGMRTICG